MLDFEAEFRVVVIGFVTGLGGVGRLEGYGLVAVLVGYLEAAVPAAVLDIAALSFLGLGIRPPTPELGAMTAEGAEHMVSGRWWMSVFPGVFIMLMALSFTLIGDGLRDLLDPRHSD